jgi:hypothetical protein
MELSEAIRIGYRAALATVQLNGLPVPVFGEGSIKENQQSPYIIITTFTGAQRIVDRCKVYECTQLIDIVTESQSPKGFGDALNIADQVENLINPVSFIDVDITANGYRIGNTFTLETRPMFTKSNISYVYRVLKRFSHVVSTY